MRTFNEIWNISKHFDGWLYDEEAQTFYDIVSKMPQGAILIELGSYAGKSSSIIGALAQDLNLDFITVDDFSSGDVEAQFHKNMKMVNAKYKLIKGKSQNVIAQIPNNIDFLFIDTIHIYKQCKLECDLYLPNVKDNGIVCFHDYGGKYTGIKQAVDERQELINKRLIYSLLIANKQ